MRRSLEQSHEKKSAAPESAGACFSGNSEAGKAAPIIRPPRSHTHALANALVATHLEKSKNMKKKT
jgi:hypothetical protein